MKKNIVLGLAFLLMANQVAAGWWDTTTATFGTVTSGLKNYIIAPAISWMPTGLQMRLGALLPERWRTDLCIAGAVALCTVVVGRYGWRYAKNREIINKLTEIKEPSSWSEPAEVEAWAKAHFVHQDGPDHKTTWTPSIEKTIFDSFEELNKNADDGEALKETIDSWKKDDAFKAIQYIVKYIKYQQLKTGVDQGWLSNLEKIRDYALEHAVKEVKSGRLDLDATQEEKRVSESSPAS